MKKNKGFKIVLSSWFLVLSKKNNNLKQRTKNKEQRTRAGFTLIELSIVLTIIGLVIAMGVSSLNASLKSKKRNATIEKLEVIQKAIDDFQKLNGRLPCVARRNDLRGNADYAREMLDIGGVNDCDNSPSGGGSDFVDVIGTNGNRVLIGVVPTRTLGLQDSFFKDGWNNRFLYAVTENLASSSLVGGADIGVWDEFDDPISDDPFSYVILGHGQDRKGTYLFSTGAQAAACGTGTQDQENCDDGNAIFRDALFNDGQVDANFFDDLIKWKIAPSAGGVKITIRQTIHETVGGNIKWIHPVTGDEWRGAMAANGRCRDEFGPNSRLATREDYNNAEPDGIQTYYRPPNPSNPKWDEDNKKIESWIYGENYSYLYVNMFGTPTIASINNCKHFTSLDEDTNGGWVMSMNKNGWVEIDNQKCDAVWGPGGPGSGDSTDTRITCYVP